MFFEFMYSVSVRIKPSYSVISREWVQPHVCTSLLVKEHNRAFSITDQPFAWSNGKTPVRFLHNLRLHTLNE